MEQVKQGEQSNNLISTKGGVCEVQVQQVNNNQLICVCYVLCACARYMGHSPADSEIYAYVNIYIIYLIFY
jgi:hypothetical protein